MVRKSKTNVVKSLTNLPDDVLCHILSLGTLKTAVRMSVLSHEWKDKWKILNNLIFDDTELYGKYRAEDRGFIKFVRDTLDRAVRIRKFERKCLNLYGADKIEEIIQDLIGRQVPSLRIKCLDTNVDISHFFRESYFLKELRLSMATIFNVHAKNFNGIVFLTLAHITFNFETTNDFTLSFPVLKELEMKKCIWMQRTPLVIDAPVLSSMRYVTPPDVRKISDRDDNFSINIRSPVLTKFESPGGCLENFMFEESNVIQAGILNWGSSYHHYTKATSAHRLQALLIQFPNVEILKISTFLLKAIGDGPHLPILYKVQQLSISYEGSASNLLLLLAAVPRLISIVINMLHLDFSEENVFEDADVPMGSLEVVTFVGLTRSLSHQRLVKFLARTSPNLKSIYMCKSSRNVAGEEKGSEAFYSQILPLSVRVSLLETLTPFPTFQICE